MVELLAVFAVFLIGVGAGYWTTCRHYDRILAHATRTLNEVITQIENQTPRMKD